MSYHLKKTDDKVSNDETERPLYDQIGQQETDWMHDTARCLGYPSDSTRAAREWARETTCGRPAAPLLAPVAQPSPPRLDSPPQWLNSRPRGSTLPPLAPVAQLFAPVAQLSLSLGRLAAASQ